MTSPILFERSESEVGATLQMRFDMKRKHLKVSVRGQWFESIIAHQRKAQPIGCAFRATITT
jgi:hypothetical protein